MAEKDTNPKTLSQAVLVAQVVSRYLKNNPDLHGSMTFNFKAGKLAETVNIHQSEKINQPRP